MADEAVLYSVMSMPGVFCFTNRTKIRAAHHPRNLLLLFVPRPTVGCCQIWDSWGTQCQLWGHCVNINWLIAIAYKLTSIQCSHHSTMPFLWVIKEATPMLTLYITIRKSNVWTKAILYYWMGRSIIAADNKLWIIVMIFIFSLAYNIRAAYKYIFK